MVVISFTRKEAEQIKRSLEWSRMMDGDENSPIESKRMDVIAPREFINKILDKIYYEVSQQL